MFAIKASGRPMVQLTALALVSDVITAIQAWSLSLPHTVVFRLSETPQASGLTNGLPWFYRQQRLQEVSTLDAAVPLPVSVFRPWATTAQLPSLIELPLFLGLQLAV